MFVTRKKALKLVHKKKAEFLMTEQVLKLLIAIKKNLKSFNESKKQKGAFGVKCSIFLRDKDICQYCGKGLHRKDRTLDHIVPRSKGGATSYMNCVASCRKCNQKKGDKAAHEVGLSLIKSPYVPSQIELLQAMDKNNLWKRFKEWLQSEMNFNEKDCSA